MDEEYLSTKETRKILGVTTPTLRRWAEAGKVRFRKTPNDTMLYNKKDIFDIAGKSLPVKTQRKIVYCRVSSRKQMDDLERQKNFFKSKYPDYDVVSDIGSGLNWKRTGLKTILESAMSGDVSEVVVAHRDRLCRFGFELIEFIFEKNNVKLTVLNSDDREVSIDEELSDDIMSIIHVYSCRKMGRRRYSNNESKEIENISK